MFQRIARVLALGAVVLFGLTATQAAAQIDLGQNDPAYITLGVGGYDVLQNDDTAVDFRLEYRHNKGLWIFKPWAGVEVTTDGAVYGVAGIHSDIHLGDRVVITPSFGVGAYHDGNGKELGSVVEFRSQVELAYVFENQNKLGVAIGHISNAGIGDDNPGTEIVNLYYSIPLGKVFPN